MLLRTLILLLIAFSSAAQAQSWQLFPLDSLRCHEVIDANGDTYLSGMDYRSHSTNNGETTIHLDSFSKSVYIPFDFNKPRKKYLEYLYLTGNSVFGHSINVTDEGTTMYFVNDSVRTEIQDSIFFISETNIDEQWLFYENDSIAINAHLEKVVMEQTPLGWDSVRYIKLESYAKRDSSNRFSNIITYSKRFGMLKALDFDSLRKFGFTTSFEDTISLFGYKEYSTKDFFAVRDGTRSHGKRSTGDWNDYTVYHTYFDYYEKDDVLHYDRIVLKRETTSANGVGPWIGDTTRQMVFVPEFSSDTIFNPIPNAYSFGKYRVERLCSGRAYRIRTSNIYKAIHRVSFDSIGSDHEIYDISLIDFTRSYVNGIGLESSFYRGGFKGMKYYTKNIIYFKTPHCTIGTQTPIFASTGKLEDRKLWIYPNPVESTLYIKNTNVIENNILIYNALGQSCSFEISNNSVDVSTLVAGIYFLEIVSGNATYSVKFVKR